MTFGIERRKTYIGRQNVHYRKCYMGRSGKENQLMFFIALSDKLCVDRSNALI